MSLPLAWLDVKVAVPLMYVAFALIWLSSPLWVSMGLAFLSPTVTRVLFRASCMLVLPIIGYRFLRYAKMDGIGANEWLVSVVGLFWLIVPFGVGHVLSKGFHAWRASNHHVRDRS
jgi:hypothetical protein